MKFRKCITRGKLVPFWSTIDKSRSRIRRTQVIIFIFVKKFFVSTYVKNVVVKLHVSRSNEFHRTNNGNFIKLQRTIKTSLKQRHDPDGCMINLSKHSFSKDTYKLLNKNSSFIPTSGIYSKSKLNDELQNLYHLIKLEAYFIDTESTTKKDENTIFIPGKQKPWTPSQNHHSIETVNDLVQHDINEAKILNTKRPKDNLTKGEQKALEELSKRDDIIITNAD